MRCYVGQYGSVEMIWFVMSANVVLNQWHSTEDKFSDHYLGLMTQEDGDERWVAPKDNKVKVNTDAALFSSTNCYSFAFVVRNHEGSLVEAQSRCCPGNTTPEIAEALGIREALSWLKEQLHRWRGGNRLPSCCPSHQRPFNSTIIFR